MGETEDARECQSPQHITNTSFHCSQQL